MADRRKVALFVPAARGCYDRYSFPPDPDGTDPAQLLAREVAYFHKRAGQIRYGWPSKTR